MVGQHGSSLRRVLTDEGQHRLALRTYDSVFGLRQQMEGTTKIDGSLNFRLM
jgi:hypothetical protein